MEELTNNVIETVEEVVDTEDMVYDIDDIKNVEVYEVGDGLAITGAAVVVAGAVALGTYGVKKLIKWYKNKKQVKESYTVIREIVEENEPVNIDAE